MLDLPQPLTPADCDLQDFKFMPLDVARLRDSDMASEQTPEENWAAVLLWSAAWHQVPAASMPDSDNWIAKAAGYMMRGRIDPRWKDVRPGAMRGFILCDDGRWYHSVVAEKANDSWLAKLRQRLKTECARIKKHNERHQIKLPMPEFDAWLAAGCPAGHALPVSSDTPLLSPGRPLSVTTKAPSKGQGEGQGQGIKEETPIPPEDKTSRRKPAIALQTFLDECKAEGRKPIPEGASVFAYADKAGIPQDFLRLQWLEFKDRYADGSKRYKDWPAVFSKSVRGNWFKLWFADSEGGYKLSTIGIQAQNTHEGRK